VNAMAQSFELSDAQKLTYTGMLVLKLMDLAPDEGGMTFPTALPPELAPLEPIFDELMYRGYVDLAKKKDRYVLTQDGLSYLGRLIDEAEGYIDQYDDVEVADMVASLRARRLDPFRVRYLWGWYQGELDDLVMFQRQRGVDPVEELWAYYLTGDDLFEELAADLDDEEEE